MKILIARDLNPEYVEQASLRSFVGSHYDLVLLPGKGESDYMTDSALARVTPPWIAGEVPALIDPQYVLICAGGNAEELKWYGEVAAHLANHVEVLCVAPELPPHCPPEICRQHWPALDLMGGAKAVVGGGGYNTVHECLASGVPLIARPWPRKYDRQLRRLQHRARTVDTPREAAAAALDACRLQRTAPRFVNGAFEAAGHILKACGNPAPGVIYRDGTQR